MAIKIGDAHALTSSDWLVTPDDRQTLIQTIGGVEVQDLGYIKDGDKFTCKAVVFKTDADLIFNYWHNRTLVNVTDEAGFVYENLRVLVKRYSYVYKFSDYLNVELEFWKK